MTRASIPSTLSAVPSGTSELRFFDRAGELAASVSCTTSRDVPMVRTFFGPTPTVSRGDVLCPSWRRGLATDLRLCYWPTEKRQRTALLRLLTDVAAEWGRP